MFINMICLAQELPKPKVPIKPITAKNEIVNLKKMMVVKYSIIYGPAQIQLQKQFIMLLQDSGKLYQEQELFFVELIFILIHQK